MIRIQSYDSHPELWFASRVVISIQSNDSHPELWFVSRAVIRIHGVVIRIQRYYSHPEHQELWFAFRAVIRIQSCDSHPELVQLNDSHPECDSHPGGSTQHPMINIFSESTKIHTPSLSLVSERGILFPPRLLYFMSISAPAVLLIPYSAIAKTTLIFHIFTLVDSQPLNIFSFAKL